jgi:hypothetical protein
MLRSSSRALAITCSLATLGCSLVLPSKDDLLAEGGESLESRCNAEGILVCEGFDREDSVFHSVPPARGLYAGADGTFRGSWDARGGIDDSGCLRFDIEPGTGANDAGQWTDRFLGLGETSELYAELSVRMSPELLEIPWSADWSQVTFHHGTTTCGPLDLILSRYPGADLPFVYTNCDVERRGLFTNGGVSPFSIQQGAFDCPDSLDELSGCFLYSADAWMTFSFHVSIGHWGMPDSSVEVWVETASAPRRQFIDAPVLVIESNSGVTTPDDTFDAVTLLPYFVDKLVEHPLAHLWYDELIVSSSPIPPR